MKLSATLSLLQELYRERLALFDRHIKGAQAIADYEFNNTYQYVIGREEHHLQWVRRRSRTSAARPTRASLR